MLSYLPCIEAAALGASESAALGAGESALSGTASAAALHTFTLDSCASRYFFRDDTTVTPLTAPVAVSLADPCHSSTVLPCPVVPSRSLPPLPPSPAPPCLPCVEGQQRAAPHSSSFPPNEAPLQTLHLDVWGPARVRGQGRERYILLDVDDYSRYTTVIPLRRKGHVPDVLIPWICIVRLQLRERFETDPPVLRLHIDRGGELSFDLLRAICRAEGIRQTFTLRASPQQNGVAERRIGLVMEFYHPTSRRVLPSQDITFDESVPFYRLFPYRTAHLPPPPLFLTPGPPSVDPLPPQGLAPSGVSQVDRVEPVKVAVDSGAARGVASGGAEPAGAGPGVAGRECAEPGGAELERAEPGGSEPGGAEPGVAESEGAEPGAAELGCAEPGGPSGVLVVLLELELVEVLEPLVPEVLILEVPELQGLEVLLELLEVLELLEQEDLLALKPLEVLLEVLVLLVLEMLEVLELLELEVLLELELELLLELVLLVVLLVLDLMVLQELELETGSWGCWSCLCWFWWCYTTAAVLRSTPSTDGTSSFLIPLSVPLPSPPASSLADGPGPESDSLRDASPTVTRLLATVVTGPSFQSTTTSALVAELVDFTARCRLDCATSLVAESESVCPPSFGGECALCTDVLEDRHEDFECFAAPVPHLVSMLITPEGDPDALDILTPRSYVEAIEGPYSSQWQLAMDAEMASWKSTGTYVD
ncbi:unnamed protein product [Closterium sp. NIES-65]|nr:unnamed protein product [Closterium sp. NIES-65]